MYSAHLSVLLDRSGSMADVIDDTIGGFNTFTERQRAVPGHATMTLAQFDDHFEYVFEGRPLDYVFTLTKENYVPRGSTALIDAGCRLIDDTGAYLQAKPRHDRPAHVFCVIITDGKENASRVHRRYGDLAHRITHQKRSYQWEFVFLGADQDAIAEATKLGIGGAAALNFTKSPKGVHAMYGAVAQNISEVRAGLRTSVSFTDAERSSAMDR